MKTFFEKFTKNQIDYNDGIPMVIIDDKVYKEIQKDVLYRIQKIIADEYEHGITADDVIAMIGNEVNSL